MSERTRVNAVLRERIMHWHDNNVSVEDTARLMHLHVDEVKRIIWEETHPVPEQPKRPEFIEPPAFDFGE